MESSIVSCVIDDLTTRVYLTHDEIEELRSLWAEKREVVIDQTLLAKLEMYLLGVAHKHIPNPLSERKLP